MLFIASVFVAYWFRTAQRYKCKNTGKPIGASCASKVFVA